MDPRVFGDDGVLPLDIEQERLEVCRHDGWRQRVDLPQDECAYSLGELPHRLVDQVSGRGVSNSPSNEAVRSVEVTTAMPSSANARCAFVTVYRGEGSEG